MVHQAATRRVLPCRMVRDNLDKAVVESQKAETRSRRQAPEEEPARAQRGPSPRSAGPESPEPTEGQLDLLQWDKLRAQHISEEELDIWCQPVNGADGVSLPTHIRPFRSAAEYRQVKRTYQQLQHSGYYWGPMTMEEAHAILARAPAGTFLIRDSGQPDVFFTLSYQSDDGPTSVRILLDNLLFSLHGSSRTFASLPALLTYYSSSSCKLTTPYRKQRPERLKQICRRALVAAYGADNLGNISGLSAEVKDYVRAYPHCI